MKGKSMPPRVGTVRPSQLMFSHGVGSLVDLPNLSVIVGGLDGWADTWQQPIPEDRLLAAVKMLAGLENVQALKAAPWMEETRNPSEEWARVGVPVFPFPRWMRCTFCNLLIPVDSGLLQLQQDPYRPERTRYVHSCRSGKNPPLAVPARFVTACPDGHLDEFPWVEFCHYKAPCTEKPQIRANEIGGGSRSTDVQVECLTCGQKMHVSQAFGEPGARTMPRCRGRHPHLRQFDAVPCPHQLRAVLLGASNAWFPVTRSALALPVSADPLGELVAKFWSELSQVPDRKTLDLMVSIAQQLKIFQSKDLGKVWELIAQRKAGTPVENPAGGDLLPPEWKLFDAPGTVPPSADFRLRVGTVSPLFEGLLERLVQAERLRVVTAMCGFTRIDGPDSGVAEDAGQFKCAPLSKAAPKWVPAAESHGEGLFIQLSEARVAAWEQKVEGEPRLEALRLSHQRWRERRGLDPAAGWPGARYVLLHSLAHALINELSVECGYSPASIQERIYSREPGLPDGPMAGILIYTAASDSEGTLGGLVSLGEADRFERILRQALERAKLCSADPLCAEHTPDATEDALHNASCHACLFVPETSCERGNRYLDRATLVATIGGDGTQFFTGI